MILICDDYNEVYIWVDDEDHDHDHELSPHFDYEEDALEWRERIKKEVS